MRNYYLNLLCATALLATGGCKEKSSFEKLISAVPISQFPVGTPNLEATDSIHFDAENGRNQLPWATDIDSKNRYRLNDQFDYSEMKEKIKRHNSYLDENGPLVFAQRFAPDEKGQPMLFFIERFSSYKPEEKYPQWILLWADKKGTLVDFRMLAEADLSKYDLRTNTLFNYSDKGLTQRSYVGYVSNNPATPIPEYLFWDGSERFKYAQSIRSKDVDWGKRRVLYRVLKHDDGSYFVTKTNRLFIVDNKILIEEYPMEPLTRAIYRVDCMNDTLIKLSLSSHSMGSSSYSDYLSGEPLRWSETENYDFSTRAFTKDTTTYLWSSKTGLYTNLYIDTNDILPSGYNYTNRRTTPHDPATEDFRQKPMPVWKGVFDLDEEPQPIGIESPQFIDMERPFEGEWLALTSTPIGEVVYDYPQEDDEDHHPSSITVELNRLTEITAFERLDPVTFDRVEYYPADGSYYLPLQSEGYSFKWIDRQRHIGQWTFYRIDKLGTHIQQQANYILSSENKYPVIMYDWA